LLDPEGARVVGSPSPGVGTDRGAETGIMVDAVPSIRRQQACTFPAAALVRLSARPTYAEWPARSGASSLIQGSVVVTA
jgi:hypothetical protein